MTKRFTTLATTRTRRVLVAAVGLFLLAAVFGAPVTGMLGSSGRDFQDPASQYERANTAITHATGQDSYYEVIALLRGPTPIAARAASGRAVQTLAALLAAQPGFRHPPKSMIARSSPLLSRDGRQTIVTATYADGTDATDAVTHVRTSLSRSGAKATLAGMSVRFGGYALINKELNERTTSDLARAELLGLPFLLLLSFWFFRGLVAALLPILLTFLALRVIDQFVPVSRGTDARGRYAVFRLFARSHRVARVAPLSVLAHRPHAATTPDRHRRQRACPVLDAALMLHVPAARLA